MIIMMIMIHHDDGDDDSDDDDDGDDYLYFIRGGKFQAGQVIAPEAATPPQEPKPMKAAHMQASMGIDLTHLNPANFGLSDISRIQRFFVLSRYARILGTFQKAQIILKELVWDVLGLRALFFSNSRKI